MSRPVFLLWALLIGPAGAQDEKPSPTSGGVNEVRVTQAIEKGIQFLRTAKSPDLKGAYQNSDELILWTMIHAGVPPTDPRFLELFQSVTTAPLKRTYKVALQAMCLEELDRVRYQEKIAQCGQFLLDNQCRNGQWSYGNPVESAKDVKVPEPGKKDPAPTGSKPGSPAAKPKAAPKIHLKKTLEGPESGDNSNSQYAALGLRACHDAGIVIPDASIALAIKAWRETQFSEEGRKGKDGKPMVASGGAKKAEGWNYKTASTDERAPYQAMTAGAIAGLVIYAYIQNKDWKKDATVQSGMSWLADKFEIQAWNGYSMYALERAGILYGTETIGTHHWYREGSSALLGTQKRDGSWGEDADDWYGSTWDTCFAILFLRRATRPLVATGSK